MVLLCIFKAYYIDSEALLFFKKIESKGMHGVGVSS